MADVFQQYLEAPDLDDPRRGLALLDVALDRVLDEARQLETPDYRKRALALLNEARRLMSSDPGEAGARLRELGEHLAAGCAESAAWSRAGQLAERRSRVLNDTARVAQGGARLVPASALAELARETVLVVQRYAPARTASLILADLDRRLAITGAASAVYDSLAVEVMERDGGPPTAER